MNWWGAELSITNPLEDELLHLFPSLVSKDLSATSLFELSTNFHQNITISVQYWKSATVRHCSDDSACQTLKEEQNQELYLPWIKMCKMWKANIPELFVSREWKVMLFKIIWLQQTLLIVFNKMCRSFLRHKRCQCRWQYLRKNS